MGIDVGNANSRASELRGYASRLRAAKNNMEQYNGIFGSCWQGTETTYYMNAVASVEWRLEQAAVELEAIGNSIVSTASQIRAEEEAAERARREAEERARREAEERARREAEEWARQEELARQREISRL